MNSPEVFQMACGSPFTFFQFRRFPTCVFGKFSCLSLPESVDLFAIVSYGSCFPE